MAAAQIIEIADTEAFAGHSSTSISRTVNLGTATRKEIWVVIATMVSVDDSTTASSVQIGGNAMTLVAQQAPDSYLNATGILYYKYQDDNALGSSATLSATFNSNQVHSGVIVFTVDQKTALFDSYGADADTPLATEGSIDTSTNGFSFYCGALRNQVSTTVDHFTNDAGFDFGSSEYAVYAYESPETGSARTIANPDSASSSQGVTITGISVETLVEGVSISATEADDTATFEGTVDKQVRVATVETDDTAAFIAAVQVDIELAAVEGSDSGGFSATYTTAYFPTFAGNEDSDSSAFSVQHLPLITFQIQGNEESDSGSIVVDNAWEELVTGRRAVVVYRCVIEADGYDDIVVPISSWQATIQSERSNFLQVVVPSASDATVTAITDRVAGTFRIDRGARFVDGNVLYTEMARGSSPSITIDTGSTRQSVTIRGYSDSFPTTTPETRTLPEVQTISINNGYRVRCGVDWRLRPGMTALVDGVEFEVSYINYIVDTSREFMDVGERTL